MICVSEVRASLRCTARQLTALNALRAYCATLTNATNCLVAIEDAGFD